MSAKATTVNYHEVTYAKSIREKALVSVKYTV